MAADPAVGPSSDRPGDARGPLLLSILLGLVFGGSWLGYTAATAEDGRRTITDWLDPMLAGATIAIFILAQLALLVGWEQLPGDRARRWAATALIVGTWLYVGGEVLSNTITVGEPPADIGSILEIAAGVIVLLAVATFSVVAIRQRVGGAGGWLLGGTAVVFLIGMLWWFSHPIDQSQAGALACNPGNALYNAFHQPCEGE